MLHSAQIQAEGNSKIKSAVMRLIYKIPAPFFITQSRSLKKRMSHLDEDKYMMHTLFFIMSILHDISSPKDLLPT